MSTSENKPYKSSCLSCGKEWYYTKKDLRQSEINQHTNKSRKSLGNLTSMFGKNKVSDIINNADELPEIAHKCPVCGSKNVSLEFTGEKKRLSRRAVTGIISGSVALLIIIILSIAIPVSIHIKDNKEQLLSNITFEGINTNSAPLAASDLKLFKKNDTYTVVATLKKNSTEPQEGYFEFNISLFDKNGKRIKSEHIDTMPTPDNDTYSLLEYGNEEYLEHNIYISDKSKPVKVTFSDIKELDKTYFINYMLEQSKSYFAKQDTEQSKKYALEVLKYDPENIEAKALSGQVALNTPTADTKPNNVIIGSDKDTVRKIFDGYKETKSIMSDNALDFENNDLLITVYFNGEDKADGVLFMQNSLDGVDTLTGEGSYISKHYDELVAMATNDPNVKIETDLTKYNSQGVKKYPMEIYIGNIPESKPKSTENTDSGYAQFNPETGHFEKTDDKTEPKQQSNNTETKPKSEFSYCLSSGIVKGVKLYSAPNNDSYVGTITSFSNNISDERGKKTKAVYISGGKNDGWYKRNEIGRLYVRNDDPCLPSGRYVAESAGVD